VAEEKTTLSERLSGKWDRLKDPFGEDTEGINWKAMGSFLGTMGAIGDTGSAPTMQVGRLGDRGAQITPGVTHQRMPTGSPMATLGAAASDPAVQSGLKALAREFGLTTPAVGLGGELRQKTKDGGGMSAKEKMAKIAKLMGVV
jgi:hypothetical protein